MNRARRAGHGLTPPCAEIAPKAGDTIAGEAGPPGAGSGASPLLTVVLGLLVGALAFVMNSARAAARGPAAPRPPPPALLAAVRGPAAAAAGPVVASAAAPMGLQEALLTRRTVNAFEATLPPGWEGPLAAAVDAAQWAPNHKRTEPWRFHLLGEEAIRRVCELNAELVRAKKGDAAAEKKLQRWLAMPGWLVCTCVGSGEGLDDPGGRAREDYAACCCAIQNLCLSLHASGLGSKWTTGAVNFADGFKAATGVPDDEYVVGTIWFGRPAGPTPKPVKKLALVGGGAAGAALLTRHK